MKRQVFYISLDMNLLIKGIIILILSKESLFFLLDYGCYKKIKLSK